MSWQAVVERTVGALGYGLKNLIGGGPQCLIPANPPKVAMQSRRDEARGGRRGDPTYVHAKDAGVRAHGGLPRAPGDDRDDDDRDDDS